MAKRLTAFLINLVFAAAICLYSICAFAKASSFIIVTHPSTQGDSISEQDLRDIYNGDRVFWISGKRVRAARLPDDNGTTADFLQLILSKTSSEFIQLWRHKLFSGKGLPPKVVSDAEKMISYIEENEGSIGFIPVTKNISNSKVKVLEITK